MTCFVCTLASTWLPLRLFHEFFLTHFFLFPPSSQGVLLQSLDSAIYRAKNMKNRNLFSLAEVLTCSYQAQRRHKLTVWRRFCGQGNCRSEVANERQKISGSEAACKEPRCRFPSHIPGADDVSRLHKPRHMHSRGKVCQRHICVQAANQGADG
jgi:hypothetical protein